MTGLVVFLFVVKMMYLFLLVEVFVEYLIYQRMHTCWNGIL